MRISTSIEWDVAGGVLIIMILTLNSTRPTYKNKKKLKSALELLKQAKVAWVHAGLQRKCSLMNNTSD